MVRELNRKLSIAIIIILAIHNSGVSQNLLKDSLKATIYKTVIEKLISRCLKNDLKESILTIEVDFRSNSYKYNHNSELEVSQLSFDSTTFLDVKKEVESKGRLRVLSSDSFFYFNDINYLILGDDSLLAINNIKNIIYIKVNQPFESVNTILDKQYLNITKSKNDSQLIIFPVTIYSRKVYQKYVKSSYIIKVQCTNLKKVKLKQIY